MPTANLLIGFKVSGVGVLMGVGNGDFNCLGSDKEARRSLFNGLAQAIVQSTKTAGEIHRSLKPYHQARLGDGARLAAWAVGEAENRRLISRALYESGFPFSVPVIVR